MTITGYTRPDGELVLDDTFQVGMILEIKLWGQCKVLSYRQTPFHRYVDLQVVATGFTWREVPYTVQRLENWEKKSRYSPTHLPGGRPRKW